MSALLCQYPENNRAGIGQDSLGLAQRIATCTASLLPDNVIFEGGAGETVRRSLPEKCNTRTLLPLPTGIFHVHGSKADVFFFDKRPGSEEMHTKELWIYDTMR